MENLESSYCEGMLNLSLGCVVLLVPQKIICCHMEFRPPILLYVMYGLEFNSLPFCVTSKLNHRFYLWWPEKTSEVDASASGGGDLDFLLFVKRLTILRRSLSFFSFCKKRRKLSL